MENKDQTKGRIEQAVGHLTDDKELQRRGKADEKAGDAKKVVDHAKEKVEDLIDSAKNKLVDD